MSAGRLPSSARVTVAPARKLCKVSPLKAMPRWKRAYSWERSTPKRVEINTYSAMAS